jgi:Legionella pneumophila major outer membrane protein precursor
MKHILPLVFLMTLLSVSSYAIDSNPRVSVLETQMSEASVRTVNGNYGGKTASAAAPLLGESWFLTADMLWWHVDEGGTDYAQLFQALPLSSSENGVHNRRLTFKWDFGFRAGIGKQFIHDNWDLFLNFTWFRAKNSSASSLHSSDFLSPLTVIPLKEASQVKLHWNIHFYTLDLNLGRSYFASPQLALHPYVGIKAAWITQHIRGRETVFFPLQAALKTRQKNAFWGVGPALGLEGKWFLDYGLHLFASGGGALLWGDFDVRHKEIAPSLPHRFNLDIHQIAPVIQLQIGIGYETNIHHDTYRLGISCRYETQYWWDQNQMPYFSSQRGIQFRRYAEDLSLQGITLDVRFDF